MSAQHTPGRDEPTAREQKRKVAMCESALFQAQEFTLLVERFIRGDLPEGIEPAIEGQVTDAMYSLRAAIAKATGSAA